MFTQIVTQIIEFLTALGAMEYIGAMFVVILGLLIYMTIVDKTGGEGISAYSTDEDRDLDDY